MHDEKTNAHDERGNAHDERENAHDGKTNAHDEKGTTRDKEGAHDLKTHAGEPTFVKNPDTTRPREYFGASHHPKPPPNGTPNATTHRHGYSASRICDNHFRGRTKRTPRRAHQKI